jgi:hypothetical protein
LDSAGIKVTVGPATHEVKGASAVVGAQSIVITLTQNGYTLGFALGGARAASVASTGDALGDIIDVGSDVLGDATGVIGGDTSGGLGLGDLGGFGDVVTNTGGGGSRGTGESVDLSPMAAAASGKPLSRAAIVLGALAALLIGAGMRRLNTAVLADQTVACTLPGQRDA